MCTPLNRIFLLLSLTFSLSAAAPPQPSSTLPPDAVALLTFKSKADTDNRLLYNLNERFDYCQWQGVKCVQGRVVRFVLQGAGLRGVLAADAVSRLDQLRVLSFRNNSLSGPIPNLAALTNLRTLFLDRNLFSGEFPQSVISLHRLQALDLSHNRLSGSIPVTLNGLDRLNYLRLEWNLFNGSVPPLNQTSLQVFNVSGNNLTGPIPVTPTLTKFGISSFSSNPGLCGEILNEICSSDSNSPFFDTPSGAAAPSPPLQPNADTQGVVISPPSPKRTKRIGIILGFIVGVLFLIAAVLSIFTISKKRRDQIHSKSATFSSDENNDLQTAGTANDTMPVQLANGETKERKLQLKLPQQGKKSGNLIFSEGETAMYNLEQLMRASAELLGRGSIGTTYKAVMENNLVVTVKRLDAGKTSGMTGEAFQGHLETVGGLRHPNLVPVRAYFQAKQEKLVIYDYQPNGSLLNLIHGSRSTRAKPLHWTSCLKIAEDIALGLAYIHQASKLIHGNLKSSNVLLGPDFEACLADYCLSVLSDSNSIDDLNSAGYKAPEIRKSSHRASSKSDVFAFGILLLELLSGKPPSQHPYLVPSDMAEWVKAMREDDFTDDNRLGMLVEVAGVCSLTSPEQRPAMRQVLKMIQEIKETAMIDDHSRVGYNGYS